LKASKIAKVAKEKVGSIIEIMKDKTLETKGSIEDKAFKIVGATKERLGFTLQTLRIKHMRQ